MTKALEISHLHFSYDTQKILEDINLKVNQNDFLAIIGPNGGGKSTLLKLVLGLLEPSSGDIKILGKKVSKSLSHIGYVPQNTNVNIDFPITVLEVVLMGHVQHDGLGEKACAMSALRQVDMHEHASKKIGSLSGGQRQRVMIARALCANPQILLLDEPTASIDVQGQRQIYDLLAKLQKSMTVIVVSHDISVILGYANSVAHINKTLTYHDISMQEKNISNDQEHFCEVEMLQLLGAKKGCSC